MKSTWKLMLAVVLLAVAAVVLALLNPAAESLPDEIQFVCVETGKLYQLDRGEFQRVPATNPETEHRTLLPVVARDETLYVDEQYASALTNAPLADRNKHVDPLSLEVRQ